MTIRRNYHQGKFTLHIKFVGRESGGFHKKFTDKVVADKNIIDLGRAFNSKGSTLMVPQGSCRIQSVSPSNFDAIGDVLISNHLDHGLILRPADCIPIVIFASSQPLLVLVHGSRTSLNDGIIEKTMRRILHTLHQPRDLWVYLGPSIKRSSYSLPAEVLKTLRHPSWQNNFDVIDNNIHIDLANFVITELKRFGIEKDHITTSSINTANNSGYFSHYDATRSGKPNGRNGFIAVLSDR